MGNKQPIKINCFNINIEVSFEPNLSLCANATCRVLLDISEGRFIFKDMLLEENKKITMNESFPDFKSF